MPGVVSYAAGADRTAAEPRRPCLSAAVLTVSSLRSWPRTSGHYQPRRYGGAALCAAAGSRSAVGMHEHDAHLCTGPCCQQPRSLQPHPDPHNTALPADAGLRDRSRSGRDGGEVVSEGLQVGTTRHGAVHWESQNRQVSRIRECNGKAGLTELDTEHSPGASALDQATREARRVPAQGRHPRGPSTCGVSTSTPETFRNACTNLRTGPW